MLPVLPAVILCAVLCRHVMSPNPSCAGDGKDIELRHQRNPDVTFDCLVSADGAQPAGSWQYRFVPLPLACLLGSHCHPELVPADFTCCFCMRIVLLGTSPRSTPRPSCLPASAAVARRSVPDETFAAIETLLPTGKGKFLELWAPKGVRRPGWSHVVETAAAAEGS